MANWQVISLDTTTPQLRAPGTGDGYSFNSGSTQLGVWTTTGLGIGTASPAATLSISKQSTALSGTGNSYGLYLYPTSSGLAYIDCLTGSANNTSLAFRTYNNGTYNTLTLDNAGNLGVGTTSPSTVGVSGYARLVLGSGSSATDGLTIVPSGTGGVQFTDAANVKKGYLQWDSSTGSLALGTAGTTRATIDSSGNVGIGTSSPTTRLEVNNGINNTDGTVTLRAVCGTAGVDPAGFFGTTGAHPLILRTNTTERLRIDSAGNMGLGVTPSNWGGANGFLELSNGRALAFAGINGVVATNGYYDTSWKYKTTGAAVKYDQITGAHQWFTAASGTAGNPISFGDPKMILDVSGNVGIGTTSPFARLSVAGSSTGSNFLAATFANEGLTAGSTVRINFLSGEDGTAGRTRALIEAASPSANNGDLLFYTRNAGTVAERARINSSGQLLVGGTGTNTINDGGGGTFTPSMFNITTSGQAGIAAYVNDGTNNRRIGMFVDNTNSIAGISVRTGASTTPPLVIYIGTSERARFDSAGNVVVNTAAVATTATDGFLYIPTCAGAPTGVPTTFTGRSPLVVDSTNNRFYVYVNGAWKYATLT